MPEPWLGTYDRQGNPISDEEYVRLRYVEDDGEYYRVALTHVGPYEVSTVWLGVDHHFGRGVLAIFETMVFLREDVAEPGERFLDQYMDRYASEAEALAGHQNVVDLLLEHYEARGMTISPESLSPAAVEIDEPTSTENVRAPEKC